MPTIFRPSFASTRMFSKEFSKETTRIQVRQKRKANCAIYGCGLSASGALAIPGLVVQDNKVTAPEAKKPLRIPFCNLRDIRHVAAGFGFSLFASRNKLYGAGLNNRFQVAGHLLEDAKRTEYYISGKRIGGLPEGGKIIAVAAGRAHSLVIVDDCVFAFGCNVHGQCGVDPEKFADVVAIGDAHLSPISLPTTSKPVTVHCSLDTSFVLTEDGKVYAFGLNEDGQCSNGKYGIQHEPAEIQGDCASERVVSISGSTDTILAISDKGDAFIWGQNEYGQAGERHEVQLTSSIRLPFTLPPLSSASSSASACVAASRDGRVFSWGVGQVGFGPDSTRLTRPAQLPEPIFDGKKVMRVFGGNVAFSALNEDGGVFMWGNNRYGLLGMGDDKDKLFPYPLFFSQGVRNVSIGADHSLFIAK